jgi:hypothetical protein
MNQSERLARIEVQLANLIKAFEDLVKAFEKCQDCHTTKNDGLNGRVRSLEISNGAGKMALGMGYKALLAVLAVGQIVNIIVMWAK